MPNAPLVPPTVAATLADAVYGIREQSDIRRGTAERLGSVDPGQAGPQPMGTVETFQSFDLSGAAVAGRSGMGMLATKSGFGMVVPGAGPFAGDVAVVCRGTAIGQDWLSNLNAALAVGPGGLPVHAGFARVYRSMKDDVAAALRGTNPRSIHVVGHSLGGAIANLFAMQFALEKRANVCLYTFGAPRPGTVPFVQAMGSEIPMGNVKRVYAMADVVPMVPIWPFLHAPANPGGLRVERGGQLLSVSAHFMDNYKPAVFQREWGALTADSAAIPDLKSVDYWIGRASEAAPWSAPALWALGKAMKAVLAMVERAVGAVLTTGLTLLDGIAQAMHAGVVSGGAAVTGAVRSLIEGIFRFLGRAVSAVENLTLAFLRYVLGLLYQSLVAVARRALGRIDA